MTRTSSDSTKRRRRGPRQRIGCESPDGSTAELRQFRAETAGLSNRLPLPSLESMRAGTAINPHTLTRRYLSAARRIGLPREWAQRHLVWLTRTIDSLWPQCQTPTRVLEEKAMAVEHHDNSLEKKLDLEKCIEVKRARIASLSAEIAADMVLVARYQREVEIESAR